MIFAFGFNQEKALVGVGDFFVVKSSFNLGLQLYPSAAPAQHALVHTGHDHLLQDRLPLNVAEEGVNVDKVCQPLVHVLLHYFFHYK